MNNKTPHVLQWLRGDYKAQDRKWWHCRPRLMQLGLLAAILLGPQAWAEVSNAGPFARWRMNHPNGLLARIYDRRHERDPQPQPYVQPQPQPQPKPYVPPTPVVPPKPPVVDPNAKVQNGNLWVVEIVPSLLSLDYDQATVLESPNVLALLASKTNHRYLCDPSTAPDTIKDCVARATTDGLPRVILLDGSLPGATRIVGSVPVGTEADLTATITSYQGK